MWLGSLDTVRFQERRLRVSAPAEPAVRDKAEDLLFDDFSLQTSHLDSTDPDRLGNTCRGVGCRGVGRFDIEKLQLFHTMLPVPSEIKLQAQFWRHLMENLSGQAYVFEFRNATHLATPEILQQFSHQCFRGVTVRLEDVHPQRPPSEPHEKGRASRVAG